MIVSVYARAVSSPPPPPLFNIILEVAMLNALYDQDIGACINDHIINNLLFADDIALIAE